MGRGKGRGIPGEIQEGGNLVGRTRGASGIGRKSQSALDPKAKEQTITTYYRRNSIYGAHYGDAVFEAVERKNDKGGIEIVKASGTFDNSNPKANTKDVTYKIKQIGRAHV